MEMLMCRPCLGVGKRGIYEGHLCPSLHRDRSMLDAARFAVSELGCKHFYAGQPQRMLPRQRLKPPNSRALPQAP